MCMLQATCWGPRLAGCIPDCHRFMPPRPRFSLNSVDLLSINVAGTELEVLKGLELDTIDAKVSCCCCCCAWRFMRQVRALNPSFNMLMVVSRGLVPAAVGYR